MAVQCNAWICSRSLAGIADSNPAGNMEVCLLCLLCCVMYMYLRGADHLSRGVLPGVVCPMSVIVKRGEGRP